MIIQAQPNRDDYEHALAAHGVWAGPKYRRRGARQQFLRWIWSVVFGSLLILAVIPEILPAADWALAPGVVIAMVVVYPLAILALALHIRSLIGSASAPLSIGIVEQGMLPKSSVSHFAKQRGLIGWIIFAFLTAALFAMMT